MALAGPCWSSQYQGVLQQLTGGAASFVPKSGERSQLARLQIRRKTYRLAMSAPMLWHALACGENRAAASHTQTTAESGHEHRNPKVTAAVCWERATFEQSKCGVAEECGIQSAHHKPVTRNQRGAGWVVRCGDPVRHPVFGRSG